MKKILYHPVVNKVLRSAARPFAPVIPEQLKFPVTGIIKVKVPGGRSIKIKCNPTSFLARRLFWGGIAGFEQTMAQLFIRLIKQANTFLDIGANIGYYTLLASTINPDVKIISFEPAPSVFLYLKSNIELNGNRATAVQKAISDKEGELEFFVSRNPKYVGIADHHLTSTGSFDKVQADRTTLLESVKVDTITLDRFVQVEGLNNIDLVKLDTEATEHLVLAGGRQVFSEQKPTIFCEVLPGKVEQAIKNACTDLGYLMYRIENNRVIKVDALAHDDAISNDHLFVHPDRLKEVTPILKDYILDE